MAKPSCFSVKIDLHLKDKLKSDLEAQGFSFSYPAHTVFSAKKEGISCTLYESGSFTVQGKQMGPFIEFYLEPEILGKFSFSHPESELNLTPHIGLDEAGKGDFFGPLCIAGVYANQEGILGLQKMGVCDSKTLSDDKVCKLANQIRSGYSYTVIRLFPLKYNELYAKFKNLNRLLAWAHVAALGDLSAKTGCRDAILDQFADKSVVERFLEQKKLSIHLEQRTKGEEDVVVAAASILARSAFLEGMDQLSSEIGSKLPKGASKIVIDAARALRQLHGKEIFLKIAKTHFKTMHDL